MQHDNASALRRLSTEFAPLRGLWRGLEADLQRMGFSTLAEVRGKDADALAADGCRLAKRPPDPMPRFCFAAIVRFAETGRPVPWWHIPRATAIRDRGAAVTTP